MFMFLMFGGTGLLMAGLGIPLWLRRIPPNHLFGFRSRATLSDETVWYAANARGGRDFVVIGILEFLVAGILFARGVPDGPAALIDAGLLVVLVLLVAARGFRHAIALMRERENA